MQCQLVEHGSYFAFSDSLGKMSQGNDPGL